MGCKNLGELPVVVFFKKAHLSLCCTVSITEFAAIQVFSPVLKILSELLF